MSSKKNGVKPRRRRKTSLLTLGSYAVSELFPRKRLLTTVMMVLSLSLVVGYIIIPAFYGPPIYRQQRREMAKQNMTMLVADCTDPNREDLFFTESKVKELELAIAHLKWISPRLELGIKVSMGGSRMYISAENTWPGEPLGEKKNLSYGDGVTALNAREMLIPEFVYNKLKADSPDSWDPNTVELSVARSRSDNDKPESIELPFKVVGILRHSSEEKVYVPTDILKELNMWCAHDISKLGEESEASGEIAVRDVRAYANDYVDKDRFGMDVKNLKVSVKKLGALEFYSCTSKPWLDLEKGRPFMASEVVELAGSLPQVRAVLPVMACKAEAGGWKGEARLTGIRPGDPMVERLDGVARLRFRSCMVSDRFARAAGLKEGKSLRVYNGMDSFPAELNVRGVFPEGEFHTDVLCTPETLCYAGMKVEPKSSVCLVYTRDPVLAMRLKLTLGSSMSSTNESNFLFITPVRDAVGHRYNREADDKRKIDSAESVLKGYKPVKFVSFVQKLWGSRTEMPKELKIRGFSDPTFSRISGAKPGRGRTSVILVRSAGDPYILASQCFGDWMKQMKGRVVHVLKGPDEEVWLSQSDVKRLKIHSDYESGLMVQCADKEQLRRASGEFYGSFNRKFFREVFEDRSYLVFARLDEKALMQHVKAVNTQTPEYASFMVIPRATVSSAHSEEIMDVAALLKVTKGMPPHLLQDYNELGRSGALAKRGSFYSGKSVTINRQFEVSPRWVDGIPLPHDVLLISREHIASNYRLVSYKPDTGVNGVFSSVQVLLKDVERYDQQVKAIQKAGYRVRPLAKISRSKLIHYEVKDADPRGDGLIRKEVVDAIRMTRPTFFDAVLNLRLRGYSDSDMLDDRDEGVELLGSSHSDPIKYSEKLFAGGWLPKGSGEFNHKKMQPLVLPAGALVKNWRNVKPEEFSRLLGSRINFSFFNQDDSRMVMKVNCRVCGVTSGSRGYVPMEFAEAVMLWSAGKLTLDSRTNGLSSRRKARERMGCLSCKLYVDSWDHVEPASEKLQKMGYRVKSSLAEQEALRKIGKALMSLSLLSGSGTYILAILAIFSMAFLATSRHIHETGVIMVYGASKADVFKIYITKGVLIAVLSFVLGSLATIILDPLLIRNVVKTVFHTLPFDRIVTSEIYEPGNWWILGTAFAFCLFFSVAGVCIVALKTACTPIINMLRSKE